MVIKSALVLLSLFLITCWLLSIGLSVLASHSQRHALEALANTSPSVSSWTLAEDLFESVESKELWGGEFFKCTEDRKSGATAATSSRKLRLSIPRTRSGSKNNWSMSQAD